MEDGFAERRHLAGDKTVPYIVNFQMVDMDKDGRISAAEFKTYYGKDLVEEAVSAHWRHRNR